MWMVLLNINGMNKYDMVMNILCVIINVKLVIINVKLSLPLIVCLY